MSYVDYEKQAEEYRREVKKCYYRSRKYAKVAAKEYQRAATFRETARTYTQLPILEYNTDTAASWERSATSITSLADSYLRLAFQYHNDAGFYSGLAHGYDELAARCRKRLGV